MDAYHIALFLHIVTLIVAAMLPLINTGVALAVVFDMVTKPMSILVALGVIATGIVASGIAAWRQRPTAVVAPEIAPEALWQRPGAA